MIGNYKEKIEFERKEFNIELYAQDTLVEKTSDALQYILDKFDDRIKRELGARPWDFIIQTINMSHCAQPRILSIGSGPCGLEIYIAKHLAKKYFFDCLDINEKLLQMGIEKARGEHIQLTPIVQDANFLSLDKTYDFVLTHASLHHLVNLEHVLIEIHRHLNDDGILFSVEATSRNGMLLWAETKYIINGIFTVLPEKFRIQHLKGEPPRLLSEFPERDLSRDGFECVRSEEIIGLLKKNFTILHEFYGYGFTRRFVDLEFGRNYKLSSFADKAILDILIVLDRVFVTMQLIKPENIFFIMKRK